MKKKNNMKAVLLAGTALTLSAIFSSCTTLGGGQIIPSPILNQTNSWDETKDRSLQDVIYVEDFINRASQEKIREIRALTNTTGAAFSSEKDAQATKEYMYLISEIAMTNPAYIENPLVAGLQDDMREALVYSLNLDGEGDGREDQAKINEIIGTMYNAGFPTPQQLYNYTHNETNKITDAPKYTRAAATRVEELSKVQEAFEKSDEVIVGRRINVDGKEELIKLNNAFARACVITSETDGFDLRGSKVSLDTLGDLVGQRDASYKEFVDALKERGHLRTPRQ